MRTSRILATAFLLTCGLLHHADAGGSTMTPFPAGSLIIPTNASFQDDCGAVSAYGLVYDVLRAEQWLAANGKPTVTINYAISDTKASPNRCRPTNLSVPPVSPASPLWDDGCDFQMTGAAPLVKLVTDTATSSASDTAITTIDTTANANVYPPYAAVAVAGATTIGYAGGPFVISAADAPSFLSLLDGTFHATDSAGNAIDFSAFRTAGACTYGSKHHINIHRAQVGFNAPVRKSFVTQPPRLAVLETDATGATGALAAGILANYLTNAGINFAGAQGCPTGGQNVANAVICPGGGTAGQIYDIFDFKDLVTNKLTILDAGVKRYTMLWTPHWVTKATSGAPPSAAEITALSNVKTFLDGQTGLMGECASISSFEGAYQNASADIETGMQLQTCVNNGAGVCAAAPTNFGIVRQLAGEPSGAMRNCSDPGAPTTCAAFTVPADEFVQTADYIWQTGSGHVTSFNPLAATSSMFRPGVTTLITTYKAGVPIGFFASRSIKDNTPGKANILYMGGHDQTGNVAGTKVALETLLLLGGTTLPVSATTTETSRSTPIVSAVGAGTPALVVGTFENVQPTPAPLTVTNSADFTGWSFPFVKGHLRATDLASITSTAAQLGTGTVLFDAAAAIPAVTPAGCGVNFSGTCRTIFTTVTTPSAVTGVALRPANVFITDGNAPTVGPLMSVGTPLVAADYVKFMDRLLAGYWNGAAYVSALGGIDRSTVAVIGASPLANSARPTIAYVGASDGMLHAICAQVDVAHGCPVLGTELWAFLPRSQLPAVRLNTAKIDGSPHVVDAFGDFAGTGTRSFRTILTFHTGSGDSTSATAAQPALYALDITNPQAPTVVWEYTIANPGAGRGADAFGLGLTLAAGPVNIAGTIKNMVIAETSNGGTNGAADATSGVVLTALDMETGLRLWNPFVASYNPTRSGGVAVPHTGVPGGAVAIDKQGNGFITDIVFGDLFGRVWELSPTTGTSRYAPTKPLFSFTTDFHPIGAPPAIYSNGSQQFAVVVSGGYVDLADVASWGAGQTQSVVAIALNAPAAAVTLTEASAAVNIPFKFNLAAGESGFAQASIVGGQLFVTSDSSDVNASGYGTTGASTGHVYAAPLSAATTVVAVRGGASSIANSGTALYSAASNQQQQLATSAISTAGTAVDSQAATRLARMLWLVTE